ncbi:glutamine synthetase family protein [uncultured Treponema sp.]|uniref:glutamine synthetase family protein n=1 Tax=uncultured Treponema sp. TaxID=162155 RepID=UPI0025FCDE08|nr:glutamine synthetase family protein [uncultured Treponema sp.]
MLYTEEEVLDYVKEEDVKFVRLAYFDLSGKQKNATIMASELPRAFENGIAFDASAIPDFEEPNKADLFLYPDASTLSVLPWRPSAGKVIRLFCDIKNPDGTPYKKDCRHLLKTATAKIKAECGVDLQFGTEFEFYLFKLNENGEATKIPFDNAGYMDIAPEDKGENIRRNICFTLEQMGITPEASHHEEGPGQNEVDFRYSDPLTAADNASTFKWIVRTKAAESGLYADFSPKPIQEKPGSGMHINISCSDSSKNENILAGILKHIEEITYYLNPTENSYNRLGEAKAPKYICWGKANRSALLRVPVSKEKARIEIRSSDSGCNPYIAFTLLIHAAIDGIKNNLKPCEPSDLNLFDPQVAKNSGYKPIPDTLDEAKYIAEKSEFIGEILG